MREVEQLIPYLYTFDARAAGKRLVELGASAVEPLIAVLSGHCALPDLSQLPNSIGISPAPDESAARERAAYLLGDMGDPRAVEPLIAAFAGETDRNRRLAIALALGKIGDPRAVATLIAALETPPWTPDFCRIVDDLARIGAERAVEPLIRVLHGPAYSYGSAARAAGHLARRSDDPRALDALMAGLRLDAEFATLYAVITALADMGDPRAGGALLALIVEMIHLPAERWDDREDNLSETEQGVVFHVLKTEFWAGVAALRRIGDEDTIAALERALSDVPPPYASSA